MLLAVADADDQIIPVSPAARPEHRTCLPHPDKGAPMPLLQGIVGQSDGNPGAGAGVQMKLRKALQPVISADRAAAYRAEEPGKGLAGVREVLAIDYPGVKDTVKAGAQIGKDGFE